MKRLTEPSTWAGLGTMALVMKGFFPAHYAICFDGVAAAAAALAGALAEKGKAAQ